MGTNGCKRDEVNWKQEEVNLKQQDDQTDSRHVPFCCSARSALEKITGKQEEGFKNSVLLLFAFTVPVKPTLPLNLNAPLYSLQN